MALTVEDLLAGAARRKAVAAGTPATPVTTPAGGEPVTTRPKAEEPQSNQGKAQESPPDEGWFDHYGKTFMRGLRGSIGGHYVGSEREPSPGDASYLDQAVEGMGHMAGDPWQSAAIAGSIAFPEVAIPATIAGFALSHAERNRQDAKDRGEPLDFGQYAQNLTKGGVTGAMFGPMGEAGGALAGSLGKMGGEVLAMGPLGNAVADTVVAPTLQEGVQAGYEALPTPEQFRDQSVVGAMTLGGLKVGGGLLGALRPKPKVAAGPTEAPQTETGTQVPGTGAGGTPAGEGPIFPAEMPGRPTPETFYPAEEVPGARDLADYRAEQSRAAEALRLFKAAQTGLSPQGRAVVPGAVTEGSPLDATAEFRPTDVPQSDQVAVPGEIAGPGAPPPLPVDPVQAKRAQLEATFKGARAAEINARKEVLDWRKAGDDKEAETWEANATAYRTQAADAEAALKKMDEDAQALADASQPEMPPEAPPGPEAGQDLAPPPEGPQMAPEAQPEAPPAAPEPQAPLPGEEEAPYGPPSGLAEVERARAQNQQIADNFAPAREGLPPEPEVPPMARLEARMRSHKAHRALEKERQALLKDMETADASGDEKQGDAIADTLDQLEARMKAIRQGLEPPGEPSAAGPEPTAPPAPEAPTDEYIPETEAPPTLEPEVPPEVMHETAPRRPPNEIERTPLQQLQDIAKAKKLPESALSAIERRAREPIIDNDTGLPTDPDRPVTYRTNDELLGEIQQEQETLARQAGGEEYAPKRGRSKTGRKKRLGDDALVDLALTPEERQARIDELIGNLQERMSYPRPVNELITGQRGLYVQEAGAGPLRQVARDYSLTYEKIGPYEAAWHENALTPEEVHMLAARGRLERFLEPDVRWGTGGAAGSGKTATGVAPPTESLRSHDVQPSEQGSPTGAAALPAPHPRSLGPERGAVLGGKRRPAANVAQRFKSAFPDVDDDFAYTPPDGFKDRWFGRARHTGEKIRGAFGEFFTFASDIAPWRFKSDPFFGGQHVGRAEIARAESERLQALGRRGFNYSVQMLNRIFKPILRGKWGDRADHMQMWRRIVGIEDQIADAERMGTEWTHTPLGRLQESLEFARKNASPETLAAVEEYHTVMRELAEEGVRRKWFSPKVLDRANYFPHMIRDLHDAISELYEGAPTALKEAASSWRHYREGVPTKELYDDMLGSIHARFAQHKMAMEIEDAAQRLLPMWDVLRYMNPAQLKENFGTSDRDEARAVLRREPHTVVIVKDAHGNKHKYVGYQFAGTKWGLTGIPKTYDEAVLFDHYNRRQAVTDIHLVPLRIAKHFEQMTRPGAVTEIGKSFDKFERMTRWGLLMGRGVGGFNSDQYTDLFAASMHIQLKYHGEAGAQFLRELTEFTARGVGNRAAKVAGKAGLPKLEAMLKSNNPPPFLSRALFDIGDAMAETPRDREFREMVQFGDIAGSSFWGNPQEHMMARRIHNIAEVGKVDPIEHAFKSLGRGALHAAEAPILPFTYMGAHLKAFIGHGAFLQAKATGQPIKSYDVNVEGMPLKYQISALMRGGLQNYDRLPRPLQNSLGRFVRFIGFSYAEGQKGWRRGNSTVLNLPKQIAQGDIRPFLDTAVRLGVPLYLAHRSWDKAKDLLADFEASASWASHLLFTVPLTKPTKDGDRRIFVPSTGFDLAPGVIVAKSLVPALQAYRNNKITGEEAFWEAALGPLDQVKRELVGRLSSAGIPAQLIVNQDRMGRPIVPESIWGTATGNRIATSWLAGEIFPVFSKMARDANRAIEDPDAWPAGAAGGLGKVAALMSQKGDPMAGLFYTFDPENLHYQAILRLADKNIPKEAEKRYRMDQAVGEDMVHPEKQAVEDEMARLEAAINRGESVPPQLGRGTVGMLLREAMTRLQEAKTSEEQQQARANLRDMRHLSSLTAIAEKAKLHPGAVAQAMEDLEPKLVYPKGTQLGGP